MNLMISKTDFKRDKKHLAFIRQLPCSVCATNYAIDAAHIRFANPCGTGLKPSDEHTVPLCRNHHSEQHLWPTGEEAWWEVETLKIFPKHFGVFQKKIGPRAKEFQRQKNM